MKSNIVALSLFCLATHNLSALEQNTPDIVSQQQLEQAHTKVVHVSNNLSDVCMLVDMPEAQLEALAQVIKKAQVTIDGVVIKDGQSTTLTCTDRPLAMNIKLNGLAAQPFLRAAGIAANLFFYLVQFEISFNVTLDEDQEELYTLNALVFQCDQWAQAAPSVTVSYRLPMTINVLVTDLVK